MTSLLFTTTSVSRDGGGLFTAMTGLAAGLLRSGNSLIVAGTLDPNTASDRTAWGAATVLAAPVIGPRSLSYAPGLEVHLDAAKAQIAHHHGIWTWSSAACLSWSRRGGKPYVVSPHGMLDPWITARGRWKKGIANLWYQREHLQRAACLLALCPAEALAVRAACRTAPVAIIPNGIDLPRTAEPGLEPPWHSLARGRKVLLFLGRLHKKKGLDELVAALAELRRSSPRWGTEWLVAIAGWGVDGYPEEIARTARDAGVTDMVCLVGPVFGDQKESCLRHAKAFILPSHSEGLPMSVLEAWSHGRPVLMTDACNLAEGFRADAAMRITTETSSLCQALLRLADESDESLSAMGQRGRALVEEKFTWDSVAQRCDQLYRWCLGGGTPPAWVVMPGEPIDRTERENG
jgi:glycosyltransferase involved in cell wall biosynthesis